MKYSKDKLNKTKETYYVTIDSIKRLILDYTSQIRYDVQCNDIDADDAMGMLYDYICAEYKIESTFEELFTILESVLKNKDIEITIEEDKK